MDCRHNCVLQLKTTLIMACDYDFGIGNNGTMLFHIPTDLANYKRITMGKNLYCGRHTFEDMGPLEGRHIIVLSRGEVPGADEVMHDFDEFRERLINDENGFLVGGASLVQKLYKDIGTIFMTRVKQVFEADTRIDDPLKHGFYISKESPWFREVGLDFKFVEYRRYKLEDYKLEDEVK